MSDSFAGSLPSCPAAYSRSASTCRSTAICRSSAALRPAELDDIRQEVREQPLRIGSPSSPQARASICQRGRARSFVPLVPPDFILTLLIQQDDLQGRESIDQVGLVARLDQTAAGGCQSSPGPRPSLAGGDAGPGATGPPARGRSSTRRRGGSRTPRSRRRSWERRRGAAASSAATRIRSPCTALCRSTRGHGRSVSAQYRLGQSGCCTISSRRIEAEMRDRQPEHAGDLRGVLAQVTAQHQHRLGGPDRVVEALPGHLEPEPDLQRLGQELERPQLGRQPLHGAVLDPPEGLPVERIHPGRPVRSRERAAAGTRVERLQPQLDERHLPVSGAKLRRPACRRRTAAAPRSTSGIPGPRCPASAPPGPAGADT